MLSHALDYDLSIESCIVFPRTLNKDLTHDVAFRATYDPPYEYTIQTMQTTIAEGQKRYSITNCTI